MEWYYSVALVIGLPRKDDIPSPICSPYLQCSGGFYYVSCFGFIWVHAYSGTYAHSCQVFGNPGMERVWYQGWVTLLERSELKRGVVPDFLWTSPFCCDYPSPNTPKLADIHPIPDYSEDPITDLPDQRWPGHKEVNSTHQSCSSSPLP